MARSPRLSEPALALLRERLGEGSPALEFARAVVLQASRAGPHGRSEAQTAERVGRLLALRDSEGSEPAAARELAGDAVLLAAFFQNVDLLYERGDPYADRVSGWVMTAIGDLDDEQA